MHLLFFASDKKIHHLPLFAPDNETRSLCAHGKAENGSKKLRPEKREMQGSATISVEHGQNVVIEQI